MLTTSELALLSPAFGFVGVIAGGTLTWLTNDRSTRRQQQLDANQRRYDKRAEVYEQMLVELNRLQREQAERIARPNGPRPVPSVQDREADARWRARAALHGSEAVRRAYRDWTGVWTMRWETLRGGTPEERAAEDAQWLPQMSEVHLAVAKAMRDDLEELNAMPGRPRRFRWPRSTQT